jgi:hypothetical protein
MYITIYPPRKLSLVHLQLLHAASVIEYPHVCTASPTYPIIAGMHPFATPMTNFHYDYLNNIVNARPVIEPTTTSPEQHKSSRPSTYSRLLQRCGYGYPIGIPEGAESLSRTYRDCGISIGDVGDIGESGNFRFLFNILEHANLGVNAGAGTGLAPEGFQPLELDDAARAIFLEVLSDFHQADTRLCIPPMKMSIEQKDGVNS